MDIDELVARGRDAQRRMNAAHLDLLRVIAEVDAAGLHARDGHRHVTSWVEAAFKVDRSTAGAWVGAALALPAAPQVADAFAAGALSFDQARPAAALPVPVEQAASQRPAELRAAARALEPSPPDPHSRRAVR